MSASPEAEKQRQNAPTVCLRKDSYIRLRDEVVKLRVRNNDLKVKLESSENATIRLQKDMEENNVVIENLKVSNEDLKQSKEELKKNENTNILAIEKLKRELEDQRLKCENSELSLKKVEELQSLINFFEEEGEALKKEVEQKNETIQKLNEEIREKRDDLEKKQDANGKLLLKNKDLKEKLEFVKISSEKELGKLKKKNNDLEEALEKGFQSNTEVMNKLKILEREKEEAQLLKQNFEEVKNSLLDQEKQVQTLKQEIDNLDNKYKEAKECNIKILKETSSKNDINEANEIEEEFLLIDEEWCAIYEARQEIPDLGTLIPKESIQNLFTEENVVQGKRKRSEELDCDGDLKHSFGAVINSSDSQKPRCSRKEREDSSEDSTGTSKSVSLRLLEEMEKFSSFLQSSQNDDSHIDTQANSDLEALLQKTDEILGENKFVEDVSEGEKGEDVSDNLDVLKSDIEMTEEEDIDNIYTSEENSTGHPSVSSEVAQLEEEVKKYACNSCSKFYKSHGALLNHKRAAHEGVRYDCDHCNYQARQKFALIRHVKYVHK